MRADKRRAAKTAARAEARKLTGARRQVKRRRGPTPVGAVVVEPTLLAPNNSYGAPGFVRRGYYLDSPFRCATCGRNEVWTAAQQKWWYEVAKGYVYSTAKLCHLCRRSEQARKAEARRVHLEGVARKGRPERAIAKPK